MAANPSIQLGTDGNWAIKEDNLLAYKKDGTRFFNKEFDFTRGSFATFVDKDGLIKVSGVTDTELVVNGDFATDSDWFKTTGWSISNGQAIANTGAYNTLQQVFPIVLGKTYEVKFDVTSITSGSVSMTLGADSGLQRNQIGSYTEIIEYNNFFASSGPRSGAGGFVGSIDNVSVKEIQTDVPRIDFTNDATGHLLLEPQSTNLLTFSEDFSQSVWAKTNLSILSNSIISPEGILSADKLIPDTTSGQHKIDITRTVTNGATVSLSAFVKKGEYNFCCLYEVTSSKGRFFDLSNGTQGGTFVGTPTTSNIENYNNDWYRISISTTVPSTSARYILYVCDTISNTSFVGDNIKGIYTWGAQLEEKSFATSYIPTNGSTATRNAEVCNNSGSVQDFNSEEGVIYAEISALSDDGTFRVISLNGGDNTNVVKLGYRTTSNAIYYEVRSGDVSQAFQIYTTTDVKQFHKVAVLYQQNNFKLFINGVNVLSDTSGVTPVGLNNISFGVGNSAYFNGKVRNVQVFKRAMSDGELYLLTVPQYQSYQAMATALNYTL